MNLLPGDVLCTRNRRGLIARIIRLAAAFRDRPNTVNHIAVFTHVDDRGVPWCIEAGPDGVGWQDATNWLKSRWTLNNCGQPKSASERAAIVTVATGMLGTPYDYGGIVLAAFEALGLEQQWVDYDGTDAPPRVVCSALADWVYEQVGLESPQKNGSRLTTPGDWAHLITERGWHEDADN